MILRKFLTLQGSIVLAAATRKATELRTSEATRRDRRGIPIEACRAARIRFCFDWSSFLRSISLGLASAEKSLGSIQAGFGGKRRRRTRIWPWKKLAVFREEAQSFGSRCFATKYTWPSAGSSSELDQQNSSFWGRLRGRRRVGFEQRATQDDQECARPGRSERRPATATDTDWTDILILLRTLVKVFWESIHLTAINYRKIKKCNKRSIYLNEKKLILRFIEYQN